MDYREFIDTAEEKFGTLSQIQKEQFRMLDSLYRDWNSRINVISRKDTDGLYLHHVLHSLAIAGYMKLQMPDEYGSLTGSAAGDCRKRFLDLGTGGGFPGIPLAILFPEASFTLCDSIGKKIKVTEAIAESIGLTNVTTVNARAEDLDEVFDYVVSRAVTSLDRFIPWVRNRYRKGIICLKGGDVVEEIASAMGRFRLRPGSVHTWRIDSWIGDPYFEGKLVIHIDRQ